MAGKITRAVLSAFLTLTFTSGVAHAAPDPDKIDKAVAADLDQDDKATFWVRVKGQASLAEARRATTKTAKAKSVYETKTQFAKSTQANVIDLLKSVKADFTSYWLVNAVKVTGDAKLAAELAKLPEVTALTPIRVLEVPKVVEAPSQAQVNAVEWNIDRVGAPRVWSELGVRGEGIVVAHIDTGADLTHPEIASRYRGRNADGTFDHNYNWHDPADICPTAAPCDNQGHGTHVMGTMLGQNGIGVAPGATWIAAKGCEARTCSDASLLSAGQWIAAPTDLSGANPRPELAPDIVNNSWGGPGGDPWYQEIVDSWVAAGIFPMFSSGNSGPACGTAGSPGDYLNSYSTGGFDINNAIYTNSSRGSASRPETKPNISAPAVSVRSSVPGGGYDNYTGTSMASPHVAATVALMWSAAPALIGDIDATRQLLDDTAIDVDDLGCGGTADDNGNWGEGRLDAFAAVQATPRGGMGGLGGTVTSGGSPVSGVTVTVSGPLDRSVVTGPDGTYAFPRLSPGDYQITASKYGYENATGTATVVADQNATADLSLTQLPSATVSGTITTAGTAEPNATVEAVGTPASTTTDAQGRYSLSLPLGTYTLRITPGSRCSSGAQAEVVVTGDVTKDVELPLRGDNFGYTCRSGAEPYVQGTEKLALTGDDQGQRVTLPFAFPFYGVAQTNALISTNGYLNMSGNDTVTGSNGTIPSTASPNNSVYAYWDDLVADAESGIYTASSGTAPNRQFVVEWRNVKFYNATDLRISFSLILSENGSVSYRYASIDSERERGTSATIGVENATGTDALLYSYEGAAVSSGQSITISASRHGLVTGVVSDANDGKPLAGATVKIGDVATFTTIADGSFYGQVLAGDYQVTVSKEHYGTFTQEVTVAAGSVTRIDTALVTGAVAASVGEITVVMPTNATRTRTFELTNLGSPAAYTVTSEAGWLTAAPTSGELAKGAKATVTVTVSSAGVAPGTTQAAKLIVKSNSGRKPISEVLVTVVVPKLQVAVDAGGTKSSVDAVGDAWSPDRKYSAGSYGWVGTSNRTHTTNRTISGTSDQALYRTARENMLEYRFDNVPAGTYTVELGFADTRGSQIGRRVFDVLVEGQLAIPALDLALEVGNYTASARSYTTTVTDGQLNVRFAVRQGQPIVNLIRISERPDKSG
ncbi:S8 family serine peptidase [Nonomuraea sp. NPDC050663]|uniref:S8 family serine peptidase n=1 Tax=Nonomuraea sp. NPDC050663 TaxID=3364370 RepID=UPI0037B24213